MVFFSGEPPLLSPRSKFHCKQCVRSNPASNILNDSRCLGSILSGIIGSEIRPKAGVEVNIPAVSFFVCSLRFPGLDALMNGNHLGASLGNGGIHATGHSRQDDISQQCSLLIRQGDDGQPAHIRLDLLHSRLRAPPPLLRRIATRVVGEVVRGYFSSRLMRWVMDRAGVMKLFTGNPFFHLPDPLMRSALMAEIETDRMPVVKADSPVLVEIWEKDGTTQIHLLNYAPEPQTITVCFEKQETVQILTHEQVAPIWKIGKEISFDLDVYGVVLVES